MYEYVVQFMAISSICKNYSVSKEMFLSFELNFRYAESNLSGSLSPYFGKWK